MGWPERQRNHKNNNHNPEMPVCCPTTSLNAIAIEVASLSQCSKRGVGVYIKPQPHIVLSHLQLTFLDLQTLLESLCGLAIVSTS